ncbi:MAG: hypothetical protein COX43_02160 [Parcubacteria group bacterium CG23_combo_of_CG06-09_8_20_14_all_35_9]|nr:MAG: hypothetical protein COX43_02160 [Parcubacteria group bacterium CG23_combo_of_CG06-09_8_20_14_all_35_9]
MSFKKQTWEKVLSPQEKILFEFGIGKYYRIFLMFCGIFLGPLLLLFFDTGIGILVGLSFILYSLYLNIAYLYAFTDKRVLVHQGWLITHLISIDYGKITDVRVREHFFQKFLFSTGSLTMNTAGTKWKEVTLLDIESPYEIKKKLDEIRETTRIKHE